MTDQKTIDSLKQMIRKQIAEVKEGESPKSMHEMGVALTKAASTCLKVVETLKSKADLPSRKAAAAVSMHIDALERLFNDMWQSPLSYLDSTPEEVVANRRADLDSRGPSPTGAPPTHGSRDSALIDHTVQETAKTAAVAGTERVVSDPVSCPVCGSSRDKMVQPDCPTCKKAAAKVKNESAGRWASKFRSSKS